MKLLTWLDIRRVIARKTNFYHNLPRNISRIGCFSDALEIGIKTSDDKEKASQILKDWFGFEKTLNNDSCNLLDPIFERNLNDEELKRLLALFQSNQEQIEFVDKMHTDWTKQ